MKTCMYCGERVTESQLHHAEAVKVERGKYAHTDCIDDTSREPDDAYYRDTTAMVSERRG